MPTKGEVKAALNQGKFEEEWIQSPADGTGHLTAGQFSGTQLGANEEGTVAELQVGTDDPVPGEAVILGHVKSKLSAQERANTRAGRPQIDVELTGGGEPAGQVQVALKWASRATAAGEPYQMAPRAEDDLDMNALGAANVPQIIPLWVEDQLRGGSFQAGKRGDFLNIVILNGGTAQTFDVSDLECRIPVYHWDGR